MDYTREKLAQLFRQCDAHDAESEARMQQLKARQPDRVIYKTFETPVQHRPVAAATMDSETQKKWDAWCDRRSDRRIQKAFEGPLEEAMGFVVAHERQGMREHVAAELEKLRDEMRQEFNEAIGALRADLTLQTAISKGEVAQIKGKADAA